MLDSQCVCVCLCVRVCVAFQMLTDTLLICEYVLTCYNSGSHDTVSILIIILMDLFILRQDFSGRFKGTDAKVAEVDLILEEQNHIFLLLLCVITVYHCMFYFQERGKVKVNLALEIGNLAKPLS